MPGVNYRPVEARSMRTGASRALPHLPHPEPLTFATGDAPGSPSRRRWRQGIPDRILTNLVLGLEVDQHVRPAQARGDAVLEGVGDRVGVLERGAGAELNVEVDV